MSRPASSALLVVDMVNAFDFPGARALLRHARRIGPRVAELKRRAASAKCPVIYCNDNFGAWRSDFKAVLAHCTAAGRPARDLVRSIAPDADDFFILKPKHSGFYETSLESLLDELKVRRLVLCGIAGEGCIHATATDAHMREYEVVIARDATASQTPTRNRNALQHLKHARYAALGQARGIRF